MDDLYILDSALSEPDSIQLHTMIMVFNKLIGSCVRRVCDNKNIKLNILE